MRWTTTLPAAALLVVAAAAPARAEDVLLVDGTVFTGKVDKVEKDGVTITMAVGGGTATLKVDAARLDPAYFYGLLDGVADQDAKAHVELAVWCIEQGLFSRARLQMRRAEQLDPDFVRGLREDQFPEMREGIATQILASAEADVKAGRLDVAEQKYEVLLLRLPDTEAGGKSREAMAALQPLLEAREAQAAEAGRKKLAEAERKAAEERAKKFASFDPKLAELKKLALEGLSEDGDAKALSLLDTALTRAKARLADLDDLAKGAGADEALAQEVADRRGRIRRGMVKVHLHRADLYLYRGAVNDAKREVEAARALDPQNADVVAAAVRVAHHDADVDVSEQRWRRARAAAGSGRFSGGRGGRR
jgi:hypothetical protein